MERVDKLLARTGRWSRKQCKELLRQGRVAANGTPVTRGEEKLDPDTCRLTVDGGAVDCAQFIYLMLHKPAGLLSATEDSRQKTVLDLLPQELRRRGLFPVGRLDKDTEGLLLLTDDGELGHRLLSPAYHVDKVYYVRVEGTLTPEDAAVFAGGMTLEPGLRCLPAGLEILEEGRAAHVTLREGKFHQIKRMMACRGKAVTYLKRLSMGGVALDGALEKGAYRPLLPGELALLRGRE